MSRSTLFVIGIPNPFYWLNLHARWQSIVFKAALKRIEQINENAKCSILAYEYCEPIEPIDPMMHSVPKVRRDLERLKILSSAQKEGLA